MKTKLFLICTFALIALVACAAPTPPAPPTSTTIPPTTTAVPPTQPPAPTPTTLARDPFRSVPTAIPVPTPRAVSQATIRVGDLDRTYLYYVPANLPRNAPLLFALHAYSGVDAARMRSATAYEFENLADQQGFVVVYPQGYQVSWNTCLQAETIPAKNQNINDVGFIRALIAKFRADYGINTSRVFAMGYSQGAGMAYRLALEIPDEITAIAAIGDNLPAEDKNDCRVSGKPIAVLAMNGTDDRMNPYNGGVDVLGSALRSTQATVEYFAKVNGQTSPPKTTRLPHREASDPTSVDRTVWNDAGKPEVVLITINGGGHTIPHPNRAFPASAGRTNHDLNGLVEIWEFFARQKSLTK